VSRPEDRLIVALDYPALEPALEMARAIADEVGMFKVGLELFNSAGPGVLEELRRLGAGVFYDGKFLDIPNTVAGAASAAARMGVTMFNVHALGGLAMMQAAREGAARGAEEAGGRPPLVIAVTILTSVDRQVMNQEVGIQGKVIEAVVRLARLAREAGLDGVVCSAAEITRIKQACGDDFLTVVPGIRPEGAARGDQARVATPRAAVEAGADYLVVGRPITRAGDPRAAAAAIVREIEI